MRWLRALKPVNGNGMQTWQYPCAAESQRGRVCVLPVRHGRMHKDATEFKWMAA